MAWIPRQHIVFVDGEYVIIKVSIISASDYIIYDIMQDIESNGDLIQTEYGTSKFIDMERVWDNGMYLYIRSTLV